MRTSHRALGMAALVLLPIAPVLAQGTAGSFDRSAVPKPGPLATFHVPAWSTFTLSNGAKLVVSEKHNLPIVSVNIALIGGANQYEPAGKTGVASLTAQMLSEGTTTKTADQLSEAQQLLGTSIGAGIGGESGSIGFTALSSKVEPALALLADMMLHPTLPQAGFDRLRGRTLVGLQQAKDQPGTMASRVFGVTLYGATHPYATYATEQTVGNITRDDLVAFHQAYFKPGRAVITVVGDITPARARQVVEQSLGQWTGGGEKPTFSFPTIANDKPTAIYLLDKPKAAQTVFALGMPGPARDTPDYYALQMLNWVLGSGANFLNRLQANIREQKGYSYGVTSSFAFGRGPGAFRAGGDIVTAKTDSALIEFMKELKGIQGDRPTTDEEFTTAREALVQRLPRTFSSVNGVAGAINGIFLQDLPATYYQDYASKIQAVTKADIVRVANKYLDLNHLNIVVVGDRATIEPMLRATKIAPVILIDADGKVLATQIP